MKEKIAIFVEPRLRIVVGWEVGIATVMLLAVLHLFDGEPFWSALVVCGAGAAVNCTMLKAGVIARRTLRVFLFFLVGTVGMGLSVFLAAVPSWRSEIAQNVWAAVGAVNIFAGMYSGLQVGWDKNVFAALAPPKEKNA
ncbi:MAG: hypothetical protein HY436_01965 [Candidatus Liptonbacteria bacterium]|nr:hypothetical protein [Candidatus Liptonbacteria bacterium]